MTTTSYSSHANNSTLHSNPSAYNQFASTPISTRTVTCPLPLSPVPVPGSPTPTTLDMKRLLAKPAPPYTRTYDYSNGSGSDSEAFSDSPHRKTRVDREVVRPKMGRSRSVQALPQHEKEHEIGATISDMERKDKKSRSRNVLRRRPSYSHHQKSSPALPMTTTTTATAVPLPSDSLRSPLPPIPPRSPLTPSILPSGSPASNASFAHDPIPRPTTAPSSSPRSRLTGVHPIRSVPSFDKPTPSPNEEMNQDRQLRSRLAQPRHEYSTRSQEECVVSVTDERGGKVDVRARLRALKGSPIPLSPSPSSSRSHSPSSRLRHPPHYLTPTSRSSSRSQSRPRNPPLISSEGPSISDSVSAGLTPAAAVVAAYKQQAPPHKPSTTPQPSRDTSIDASVSTTTSSGENLPGMEPIVSQTHAPEVHKRSATEPPLRQRSAPKSGDDVEDGRNQPYYTVFGTSSDRVVAAGGPEDHHLSWEIVPPSIPNQEGSTSARGIQTLKRKVSGRFKRAGNGTQSEGEERDERQRVSLSAERERGRTSFSGSRNAKRTTLSAFGKGEKGGLSLRLSIDKIAEVKALRTEKERKEKEKDTTPTSATKSLSSGTSTPSPSPSSGGSKIWKLMKKISTGGLREKFTNEEAPPVPSLPKEYIAPSPIRPYETHKEMLGSAPLAEGFGKAIRKKASIVLGVNVASNADSPTKHSLPSSPLSTHVSFPPMRPSLSAPRPSTTTRSSSPVSSDMASSRFFSGYKQSTMSAHSSVSSLPIEDQVPPPPLPEYTFPNRGGVGQHIVPPSELGKIHIQSDDGHGGSEESFGSPWRKNPASSPVRNQMMKLKVVVPSTTSSPVSVDSDDYVITHTPASEIAPLPLPPRRPGMFLGRMRRDTNMSVAAEAGWGDEQSGKFEASNEEIKEWEQMWGSSNPGKDQDEELQYNRSGSPMIPSFSTEDTINTFSSKRASTDIRPSKASPSTIAHSPPITHHHPSHLDNMGYSPAESVPPPRPARNPQRLARSTPTSPVKSMWSPGASSTPRFINPTSPTRRSTDGHSVASSLTITNAHRRRRSSSFLSTTSLGSPPTSPASPPRRNVMFRELGRGNPGHVLTEQEKVARWDALLERSTRAGGTLHLNFGEQGLKSDRLRFSDVSGLTND